MTFAFMLFRMIGVVPRMPKVIDPVSMLETMISAVSVAFAFVAIAIPCVCPLGRLWRYFTRAVLPLDS
jgi:hypothetical protein